MISKEFSKTILHNIIKFSNDQFRLEQNKKINKDKAVSNIKDKIKKELKENAN